jgi:hypothetical protein
VPILVVAADGDPDEAAHSASVMRLGPDTYGVRTHPSGKTLEKALGSKFFAGSFGSEWTRPTHQLPRDHRLAQSGAPFSRTGAAGPGRKFGFIFMHRR